MVLCWRTSSAMTSSTRLWRSQLETGEGIIQCRLKVSDDVVFSLGHKRIATVASHDTQGVSQLDLDDHESKYTIWGAALAVVFGLISAAAAFESWLLSPSNSPKSLDDLCAPPLYSTNY